MLPVVTAVASVFVSYLPKLLFGGVFFGVVYKAVDEITLFAFSHGLPILPSVIAFLVTKSGLIVAINLYIKIITFGFISKQVLAYGRNEG